MRSSMSSSSLLAGDEPASVSSARLTAPPSLCQALLQRGELRANLRRELVAELRQVLADLLELLAQQVGVDGEQRLELLRVEVETGRVEVLGARDPAGRRLAGLGVAVEPAEHPLEHARVLAEPGPQELAVVVLA